MRRIANATALLRTLGDPFMAILHLNGLDDENER
jgi:hypothetical protein